MNSRADIRVISPGMLSTVQDLGRRGYSAIGVGRGGAADSLSVRVGNRLVGNDDRAAAIEMTWTGGTFEFACDAHIVLAGGNVDARIVNQRDARAAPVLEPVRIRSGERLVVGPIQSGARSYLCVAGGIDVPVVLGSRSTHLVGVFGGMNGRALRAGDVLPIGNDRAGESMGEISARAREFCNTTLARRTLRAVDGALQDSFNRQAVETFWTLKFEVSLKSDRAGLRLTGRIGQSPFDGRMASEGMMPGAVQVPESGEPIILLADHPTTGGYPVIACIAAVDHAVLGQVRPGEQFCFERVSIEEARALYRAQELALDAAVPPNRRKGSA